MVGQTSERKKQAVHNSTPEADIMRTLIATAIAVVTAATLINICKPAQVSVHFDQVAITESVSAQVPTDTKTSTPTEQASKPVPTEIKPQPATVAAAPQAAPASTCAAEIGKYSSWNQNVAYNVMMAESSGDVNTLNDNPMTGDYSIGCFQINLLGANLNGKYRVALTLGYTDGLGLEQMVAWLKNPVNNVAMANSLYNTAGNWGDWKYTCQTKVQCN